MGLDLFDVELYTRQRGWPLDQNRTVEKALPEKYPQREYSLLPFLLSRNNHSLTLLTLPLQNLYLDWEGPAKVQIMVLLRQALRNPNDSSFHNMIL